MRGSKSRLFGCRLLCFVVYPFVPLAPPVAIPLAHLILVWFTSGIGWHGGHNGGASGRVLGGR
jgi:hypothetical protein